MTEKPTYEELERRVAALEKQVEQYPPEILSVLIEAFRYIPLCKTFDDAAKYIFDHCKRLTGAHSGYVALLSENGKENEVLYLDAGGLPCDVDPNLPMPIRGLREAAYKTKKVVYDNAFPESPWLKYMPDGHVKLDNVLFTPLNIEDKTVGVIGIANKPGRFDKKDVQTTKLLGDLAAVALTYAISQDSLRESEKKYRDLFENTGEALFVAQGGMIVFQNPRSIELSGYSEEEFQSKPFFDFIHEDDREMVMDYHIRRLRGERLPEHYAFRIIHKKGGILWAELNAVRIQWDGKPAVLCFMTDVTERIQAEATLRENEERIRTIGDNLQGAQLYQLLVTSDGGTKFTYVSSKVEELHECKPEDVLKDASLLFKRVHPADVDEWQKRSHKSQKELTTYDHTVRIVRKSGEIRWHRMISKPRKLDDGSVLFDGVELDVTEHKRAEDELRESLTRYDELVANVPVGVYVFWMRATGNLEFEYVSDRWCEIHQVKREDVLSDVTKVNDLVHPNDRDDFLLRNQESFLKGIPFAWEGRFLIGDGNFRWLRIESTPIVFDNADSRWFGVTWDITDRKRVEEAMQESESQISSIFRSAPVGIGSVVNRVLSKVNERLCEITGYNERELIGQCSRMLYPSDEDFEYVGREKYGQIADHGTGTVETRWQKKDGTIIDVLLSSTPVDLQDQSKGVTFTVLDITEQKHAEEALRKSEERFSLAMEASKDGIWDWDLTTGKIYCSPSLTSMLGYDSNDVIESVDQWQELIHPDDRQKAYQSNFDCVHNLTDSFEVEYRMQTHDGGWKWIVGRGKAVQRDASGKALRIIGTHRDNTDHKKAVAEKETLQAQLHQSQKMESVGRLAGGVAHDFNNMLGVILGHTELALLQADETHNLHEDLKEIQKAAKRSAEITKQLLAFARKQTISPKQLDLNDTVESMLNMLRRLIGEDIDLVWQPAAQIWPVKMDPSQIDQILANLCINARDAIADVGKITIETERKTFDEEYCKEHTGFIPGDFVLLAVSDNGCGMGKDTLDNLFEPFFTTKEVGKGTGLGLATIYGIVKQNNGFINVYSEPGQGSTFKIYLPRLVTDENTEKDMPEKKPAAGGTETILLVEDEPSILRMTRMMLERKGYTVLTATTATEAMEKAKNHSISIDLLMTDVVMPEMNGRDLAVKLMELYPNIKLLFMSGYTADVIARQGVLDDGVAFIQKPFSMAGMTAKVREVLDKASDETQV
jgi:PAS domain S-box-containing protein